MLQLTIRKLTGNKEATTKTTDNSTSTSLLKKHRTDSIHRIQKHVTTL